MAQIGFEYSDIKNLVDLVRAKTGIDGPLTLSEATEAMEELPDAPEPEDPLDGAYFYDYDGTLIHHYSKSETLALESLPELPDHSDKDLDSVEWNWTLEGIKYQTEHACGVNVGLTVRPTDGKNHIIIPNNKDIEEDYSFSISWIQYDDEKSSSIFTYTDDLGQEQQVELTETNSSWNYTVNISPHSTVECIIDVEKGICHLAGGLTGAEIYGGQNLTFKVGSGGTGAWISYRPAILNIFGGCTQQYYDYIFNKWRPSGSVPYWNHCTSYARITTFPKQNKITECYGNYVCLNEGVIAVYGRLDSSQQEAIDFFSAPYTLSNEYDYLYGVISLSKKFVVNYGRGNVTIPFLAEKVIVKAPNVGVMSGYNNDTTYSLVELEADVLEPFMSQGSYYCFRGLYPHLKKVKLNNILFSSGLTFADYRTNFAPESFYITGECQMIPYNTFRNTTSYISFKGATIGDFDYGWAWSGFAENATIDFSEVESINLNNFRLYGPTSIKVLVKEEMYNDFKNRLKSIGQNNYVNCLIKT